MAEDVLMGASPARLWRRARHDLVLMAGTAAVASLVGSCGMTAPSSDAAAARTSPDGPEDIALAAGPLCHGAKSGTDDPTLVGRYRCGSVFEGGMDIQFFYSDDYAQSVIGRAVRQERQLCQSDESWCSLAVLAGDDWLVVGQEHDLEDLESEIGGELTTNR